MFIFNDQFYIIIGTSSIGSITSESEDIGIMTDICKK